MRRKWFYAIAVIMSMMSGADAEDTPGQHGLDHPSVHIYIPMLECECKNSHGVSSSALKEQGGDASAIETACREGGEVYWIVSLSGLVPGFAYEFHFHCFVVEGADKNRHYTWTNNFSTSTSSYTVRQPLSQIHQRTRGLNIDTSVWDACIPKKDPFVIEVTVRNVQPGQTSEEALIGKRDINSEDIRLNCRIIQEDPEEDKDKENDEDTVDERDMWEVTENDEDTADEREIWEVKDVTAAYKDDEWEYNVSDAGAPGWLLPEGGKSLCSVVVVLVSGLRSALQRYSGLFPAADLDGKNLSEIYGEDIWLSSKPSFLSLPSGLHTLNLELIKESSNGARFVVYQHLIAFKTSAEPSCRTPKEQWDSFSKLGGQDKSTDRAGEEVNRVHRLDSSQKHMWRTGLRLLESLIHFPPLPADWVPPGNFNSSQCCHFTGVCNKGYHGDPNVNLQLSRLQKKERDNTGSREKGSKAEKDEHGQENASPLPQSGWKTNHHLGPPIPLDLHTIELSGIASGLLRHHSTSAASGKRTMRDFVVVELGAGWGRWSLHTIFLAKRLGIKARAICVEAEPNHAEFLRDAFWEMGVPDDQLRLVEGAIGESDGEGLFPFGISREWWGQKLESKHARRVQAHGLGNTHLGLLPREVLLSNNSRAASMRDAEASLIGFVSVPVLSLRTLLRDEPVIDLINFDCQEAEYDTIKGALSADGQSILDRVKTMVISTHSTEIEHQIFAMLCTRGWQLLFMSSLRNQAEILGGRVLDSTGDGVQVWVNTQHVDVEGEFGVRARNSCSSIPTVWPPIPIT